ADPLDNIRKHFFLRLGGDEPVAVADVFTRFILTERRFDFSTLLPFLIHPLHPVRNPTDTAFKESDAQFGEFPGNAGIHQTDKLNNGLYRTANRMHVEKTIEADIARGPFAPVVNAKWHIEALDFFVDRPERFRTQMFLHILGSDGDASKAKFH